MKNKRFEYDYIKVKIEKLDTKINKANKNVESSEQEYSNYIETLVVKNGDNKPVGEPTKRSYYTHGGLAEV